jgi:hypothetical protein
MLTFDILAELQKNHMVKEVILKQQKTILRKCKLKTFCSWNGRAL